MNEVTGVSRWTETDARSWWQAQPWPCGFNFLPSTAVNFLELWHRDTFDPATIERELGWASKIGFNAVRVNPHFLVWKHDRDGLLERIDRFLHIADRCNLSTVLCPFDDCGFGKHEPQYGLQLDPVPNVHNSRAVASPGRAVVMDRSVWPELEAYLRDIVRSFRSDERLLFWDLYNEPGNRMVFESDGYSEYDAGLLSHSQALMGLCFEWARAEAPEKPLTVGAWLTPLPDTIEQPYQSAIDQQALALSDIISYHAYTDSARNSQFIDYLASRNRPMVCTEWMARGVDSRITDQLPMLKKRDIGCFQWGLVKGRSQTHLAWPADLIRLLGKAEVDGTWFHDLLDEHGHPYDPAEIDVIKTLTLADLEHDKGASMSSNNNCN